MGSSGVPSECLHEFISRHSGLLEYAGERSDFKFAVLWHHATNGAAAQDHMAAFLAMDDEAKLL